MDSRISELFYTSDALASIALVLFLLVLRMIAGRALRRRGNLTNLVARRWTANIRNLLILVAIIGLIMIWAPQLRTFALSLTAVAIAIVVATKELILCLSGAALRTFTRAFSVGDIVEIGTSRGEVLDLNLLAARLIEFEQRDGSVAPTGRTIILPYSLLFSSPAKVLSHATGPAPHRFEMTFEPDVNIFAIRKEVENAASEALAQVEDKRSQHPAKPPPSDLVLKFGTSDIGKYRVEVTVFQSPADALEAENAIVCSVGAFVHSQRTAEATTE